MQRTRAELKVFFKKNAIPTQSNFEDLIESALNQKDDGVVKLPDDPLTLEAAGAEEALLRFSRVDAAGSKPTWLLSQKPAGAPAAGLAFQDAGGSVRLFLQSGTGNVGIGTTDPGDSRLMIAGPGADVAHVRFASVGAGQLEFVGWVDGWNINTKTPQKHLYLNRDAADSSNVYIGTAGKELIVHGGTGAVVVKGVLKADALELQQPEAWQTPALLNSWQQYDGTYNPPAYYKDGLGVVHLRGLVKRLFTTPEPQPPAPPNLGPIAGNPQLVIAAQMRFAAEMQQYTVLHAVWVTQRDQFVGLNGVVIFQLPPGHRPAFRELRAVMTNPNVAGRLDIDAQGNVIGMTGNSGWFSLDGISFRAASA